MILVSMGTQPIPCERIINTIIDSDIDDEIIIQSYYKNEKNKDIPKNIKIVETVQYDEMEKLIEKADIVIVSGTGGIFRALKKNKKVIIFTRLGRFGEALNDHGMDMKMLQEEGYAEFIEDEKTFKEVYEKCKKTTYKKYKSNNKTFIKNLEKEINKL